MLIAILGEGSQLGSTKINVEYFDQSGMKQELPKVCLSVSPQRCHTRSTGGSGIRGGDGQANAEGCAHPQAHSRSSPGQATLPVQLRRQACSMHAGCLQACCKSILSMLPLVLVSWIILESICLGL